MIPVSSAYLPPLLYVDLLLFSEKPPDEHLLSDELAVGMNKLAIYVSFLLQRAEISFERGLQFLFLSVFSVLPLQLLN